jgi:hypothetical protein
MVMTLDWGTSLVVEALVSGALIFILATKQYLLVSPIVGYLALSILTVWTFWYAKRVIGPLRGRRDKPPLHGFAADRSN